MLQPSPAFILRKNKPQDTYRAGWLLYGGPEKTKDCLQVVPPINKLPYKILYSTSLATQKYPDLLCSASHRPELAKRL